MHQGVARRAVGGLEAHGQGPEAALAGTPEGFTVCQQVLVQMKADICLQALGESFKDLNTKQSQSVIPTATGEATTGGNSINSYNPINKQTNK